MGSISEVLNFNWLFHYLNQLFLKPNRFIWLLAAGSARSLAVWASGHWWVTTHIIKANMRVQSQETWGSNQCLKVFGHIESVKILVILNPTGWLHVGIFPFFFHSFEVYSIDSSKRIGNFHSVLNFNWLFLKLNLFICNYPPVVLEPWSRQPLTFLSPRFCVFSRLGISEICKFALWTINKAKMLTQSQRTHLYGWTSLL